MSKYLKNTQKCIHLIPSLPLLFSFSWLITMFANKRSLCVKTMGLLQEVLSFSSNISTSAVQVILNESDARFCHLNQKTMIQRIHQIVSPISNSESTIFLTNICYDFFFNWQTEGKNLFWTNKVYFFNFSN